MSTVVEKARGGAAFSATNRIVEDKPGKNGAVFVKAFYRENVAWDARIRELTAFRKLDDDWDGEGSIAPGAVIVDGAISFAQWMQRQRVEAPDRVVPGVNGTILFEWFLSEGYQEIEVVSPACAEARVIQDGSNEIAFQRLVLEI